MTLLSISDLLSSIEDIISKVSLCNANCKLITFCVRKHRSYSKGLLNLHYTMTPYFSDHWEKCKKCKIQNKEKCTSIFFFFFADDFLF